MNRKAAESVVLMVADFKQLISLAREERGYVIALQNIISKINEKLSPEDQGHFSGLCEGAIGMPLEAVRACIMPLSSEGAEIVLDVINSI